MPYEVITEVLIKPILSDTPMTVCYNCNKYCYFYW